MKQISLDDLQTLIGKILSDERFAKALAEQPEQTLREAGLEPTPELLAALQEVDVASMQQLAATFNQEGTAAC